MSLNFHKQWNKDWFTSAYVNFTYAKNRVDEYDEPEIKKGTYRAQTGRSLNELQGLTAERLFMPSDFNADGSLKFGIPSQSGVGGTDLKPGDIKYVDMNGMVLSQKKMLALLVEQLTHVLCMALVVLLLIRILM